MTIISNLEYDADNRAFLEKESTLQVRAARQHLHHHAWHCVSVAPVHDVNTIPVVLSLPETLEGAVYLVVNCWYCCLRPACT